MFKKYQILSVLNLEQFIFGEHDNYQRSIDFWKFGCFRMIEKEVI